MLERAVAALKADQPAALKAFTAGTEGFKDRDLYVFCGDAADGLITAHGANSALIGQSMRDIKDKAGKAIGEEFYAVATEGKFNAVEYVWPRPGETEPSPKTSYITKAGQPDLRRRLLQVRRSLALTGALPPPRGGASIVSRLH